MVKVPAYIYMCDVCEETIHMPEKVRVKLPGLGNGDDTYVDIIVKHGGSGKPLDLCKKHMAQAIAAAYKGTRASRK